MTKHGASSLPMEATGSAEPATLRSTAKTPAKPKGWKKWKRRLSQVFKGKKKGKNKKKQPPTTVKDPTSAGVGDRGTPHRHRVARARDGSTDESPTGSEKDADRRSTDSRESRRLPGLSQDHRSGASRSASEPTDEEWEAEQRRLTRECGRGRGTADELELDDEDEGKDYEEDEGEEDEVEYEENDHGYEGDIGAQSDEEGEDVHEDVYDYDDAEAETEVNIPSSSIAMAPVMIAEEDHADVGEESGAEIEGGRHEALPLAPLSSLKFVDDETEGNITVVDANGNDKESIAYDTGSSDDEESELEGAASSSTPEQYTDVAQGDSYGEEADPLTALDSAVESPVESNNRKRRDERDELEDEEAEEEEEEEQQQEQEQEQQGQHSEDDDEDDEEELEAASSRSDQAESDQEDFVDEQQLSPIPPAEAELPPPSSLLDGIPRHMDLLYDVAAWCCDSATSTTVDMPLLLASIKHGKWTLAQLLAEKILRNHKHPRRINSEAAPAPAPATSTETALEALLARCAA